MVDKPTPIDKSEYEAINNALDTVYGQLEWWRRYLGFDGNIHYIYYHGGDRIEELIARLRGEIAFLAKQLENVNHEVGDLQDKFNDLVAYIDQIILEDVNNVFDAYKPTLVAEAIAAIESELSDIMSAQDGISKLYKMLYLDDEFDDKSSLASSFMVNPRLQRNAVMQSVLFDGENGQWFITQSDSQSPEGFVISRVDMGGNLISQMWVKGVGHGSSTFLMTRPGLAPMIYFQVSTSYYRIPYSDNNTSTIDNAIETFTPPMNGNGAAQFNNGYMTHINNLSAERILNVYPAVYDATTNGFTFPGGGASIDISSEVGTPGNDFQGIGIIRKQDITGVSSDVNMVVSVMVGATDNKAELISYEYDITKQTLTRLNNITGLQNVVKPQLADDNTSWNGNFEPEGLVQITINGGGRNGGTLSAFGYGLSTGPYGKRKHYVYGLINTTLATYINAARASFHDDASANFLKNSATKLYMVVKPGTYEIRASDFILLTDTPSDHRAWDTSSEWTLNVTTPNQNGDIVQTLTRRGYGSNVEIYTRAINWSAGGLGSDYGPAQIGYWVRTAAYGIGTAAITTPEVDARLYKKISDFNVPGKKYYVTGNQATSIGINFEGLPSSITSGRGFTTYLESPAVNDGTSWTQWVIFTTDGSDEIYTRQLLNGVRDTYGPSLVFPSSNVVWSKHVTQDASTVGLTPLVSTVSGITGTIRVNRSGNTVTMTFASVTGIGTGANALVLNPADLPTWARPGYDAWGNIAMDANGNMSNFTVRSDGRVHIATKSSAHTTTSAYNAVWTYNV